MWRHLNLKAETCCLETGVFELGQKTGMTPGSDAGFPVLKGPSRSNGSSEAPWRLSEAWAAVSDRDWFGELKSDYNFTSKM